MANTTLSIPSQTPICNPKNGVVNQEWRLWFNKLYQRAGGSDAPSNGDISQQVETNKQDIINLTERVNNVETNKQDIINLTERVNNVETDINNLQLEVAQNTSGINDLENRVTTAENDINNLELNVANNTNAITTNSNDINTLKSNTIQTIANLGTGTGVFKDKTANTANFKSLKAGTNIILDNTTNVNEIVINATGGGGGLSAGFGDITVTGSLVGSTTGSTTYFNVKGGLNWGTGKEVNNTSKVTVNDYASTSNFSYLNPSTVYYVIFNIQSNSITTSSNPTSFSLTSNAKLLWVIETDTTKISKVTDYRAMNIFIRPTTEMKVTTWYAGPRVDNFNMSIYYYQNQVADSSLMNGLSSVFPRFLRVNLSLLCISADAGYAVGEEADYVTGDGVIWGKPFAVRNDGNLNVFQGAQTKIWQASTNTWVTPSTSKWGLVCRVTLEYH